MTSRQNDNSMSIAEELISELRKSDNINENIKTAGKVTQPTKEEKSAPEQSDKKEALLPEEEKEVISASEISPASETNSDGKENTPEASPQSDLLSESVILIENDEVKEDDTDSFVVPATQFRDTETLPVKKEQPAEKSQSSEKKPKKVSQRKKEAPVIEEASVPAPIVDHVLPPTFEEKRDGALKTKIMSPDHDDADDFIFTKYKPASSHSHHKRGSSKEKNKKKNNKEPFSKKPFWKKLLIILGWVLGALLIILIGLVIAFFVSSCIGKNQLTDYKNANIVPPVIEGVSISSSNSGKTQEYNGVTYTLNENITSILCIGVDKHELGTEDDVVGTGGQADAIFLVTVDMETGKNTIIAIPRDIVTDINVLSSSGEYLSTEKMQLCLSYAYGDGREASCENTRIAVERLFYNIPIQSYFAIDIDAIASLNDAIGGVTVTMKDDFFRSLDYGVQTRHFTGESVYLNGSNAIRYVQQREVAELESSTDRMNRQINYLTAFSTKAIDMTKKDLGVPVDLFNIVSDNSATNLNVAKVSALAEVAVKGISTPNFVKVPGELTSDGTYAVYKVDNEKMYELFLETFYIPQN